MWFAEGSRTKSRSRKCSQINLWKANCRALPHSKEAFGEKATLGYSMEELFERERGPKEG